MYGGNKVYNTVYYIVKSNLHYYPPCMSQIKMLQDSGVNVIVLYGSSEKVALEELESRGIHFVELSDPRGKYKGIVDKANNWIKFREALKSYIRTIDKEKSLLWFGNAETALPMIGLIENKYNYIITYLELLDHKRNRIRLLKGLSQHAKAIVTCQETRSYLMQYWFGLAKLPYTIPNKPYALNVGKKAPITTEKGKYVLNEVDGHKYIIYQGIFQDVEYLEVVARVLNDCYPDIYFVMMGIDKRNVVQHIKDIYKNTVYVDYIPAPLHLEVTSNAYIGLLFYNPDSLNKAFCAPNKIFEYSCFGLPIIGNNIPGLTNTIGSCGAGICTDFSYSNIKEAIREIVLHYDEFSKRSEKFYHSINNQDTITRIIEDVGIQTNEKSIERERNM